MRLRLNALIIATVSPLVACATLRQGRTQNVAVASTPFEAQAHVDDQLTGITPVVFPLARRTSHTIRVGFPGCRDTTMRVEPKLDRSWILKDVFFGLGVGVLVDAITGSWKSLSPDTVNPAPTRPDAAGRCVPVT